MTAFSPISSPIAPDIRTASLKKVESSGLATNIRESIEKMPGLWKIIAVDTLRAFPQLLEEEKEHLAEYDDRDRLVGPEVIAIRRRLQQVEPEKEQGSEANINYRGVVEGILTQLVDPTLQYQLGVETAVDIGNSIELPELDDPSIREKGFPSKGSVVEGNGNSRS